VASTIDNAEFHRFFYMPTFEQSGLSAKDVKHLEDNGIEIASPDRWSPGNSAYAEGWAIGTARFFPASQIDAAYAEGRLSPSDILVTDGVPAEIPRVAGIVTLAPATPNSHVAILAKSFGIPFVYIRNVDDQKWIEKHVGSEIYLGAGPAPFVNSSVANAVLLIEIASDFPQDVRSELLALKEAEPLAYEPKRVTGQLSKPTIELTREDIAHFGGKAANFGLLTRVIPDDSPSAIAFSFDLWDAFMSQDVSEGVSLGQFISTRLGAPTWPPPTQYHGSQQGALRGAGCH
jgi:hypothetical protein